MDPMPFTYVLAWGRLRDPPKAERRLRRTSREIKVSEKFESNKRSVCHGYDEDEVTCRFWHIDILMYVRVLKFCFGSD